MRVSHPTACLSQPGPWFNTKMTSYQYRKFHCGDKTILRPSYLHNWISHTGKISSFYLIRALDHHQQWPSWEKLLPFMGCWEHILFLPLQLSYPWKQGSWGQHGPIWGWQDPGGPHVGPKNFAIWDITANNQNRSSSVIPTINESIYQAGNHPVWINDAT